MSRSQGQKLWYHVKGLVTRNQICNMKALSLLVWKLWSRLKIFKSRSNFKVKVKNYDTMWKVLSEGIHMCNMKALSLLVRNLWQRLKFFISRSNFKVNVTRSKIIVPCERSFIRNTQMKYESSIFDGLKVMAKVKVFVHATNADADADTRAVTLAPRTFVPAL